MKRFLTAFLILPVLVSLAQGPKQLKKAIELKIPREGGARAASVAWHPLQKKYYAAMAGNTSFCLGVFDMKGTRLSPAEQQTLFDVRGLWYNPNTKTLQMNGYNDFGWGEYKLDLKGFPASVKTLFTGVNQPDDQSVGAFDPKKNLVYFFNSDGNLDMYSLKDGSYSDDIELHLGVKKADDAGLQDNEDVIANYNSTTAVFTGIKNSEFALLNFNKKQIELYNAEDGYLTQTLSLPDDAPAEDILCFAYSNGFYWLFDRTARIWKGYK
jgi:hypothetical protein